MHLYKLIVLLDLIYQKIKLYYMINIIDFTILNLFFTQLRIFSLIIFDELHKN